RLAVTAAGMSAARWSRCSGGDAARGRTSFARFRRRGTSAGSSSLRGRSSSGLYGHSRTARTGLVYPLPEIPDVLFVGRDIILDVECGQHGIPNLAPRFFCLGKRRPRQHNPKNDLAVSDSGRTAVRVRLAVVGKSFFAGAVSERYFDSILRLVAPHRADRILPQPRIDVL